MGMLRKMRRSATLTAVKRHQIGGETATSLTEGYAARVSADGGVTESTSCLKDRISRLRSIGMWQKASAVWLPHGYKESKLYAVKGGSGVDLGFTRAGTKYRKAATYVEQVPYNLLSRSEEFDNASWAKTSSTVTANTTLAPDGTLTADSLLETIAVSGHFVRQSVTKPIVATTYRFSVNVKSNNRDWCLLQIGGSVSLAGVYFNVASGTVGSQRILGAEFSIVSSSIEAAANGFYKLTIVVTGTNTETSLLVDISAASADAVPSYAGDITKGLFLWGAQLTYGSATRDYFKTTDRFNVPSLDYTGSTCPALSLEPARTNLCLQSETFGTTWVPQDTTVVSNAVVAPDGLSTADSILETATNTSHNIQQVFTKAASGLQYTFSMYVKGNQRSWVVLRIYDSITSGIGRYFNLSGNGSLGGTIVGTAGFTLNDSTIVSVGNDWYRCIITVTSNTDTTLRCLVTGAVGDGSPTYLGEITKGYYLWGAQVEQASYATSYIPTTTATVSRIADSVPALFPKGTNQMLQSETLSAASWAATRATVTVNVINSPIGTLTADKIAETAVTNDHYIIQTVTKPAIPLVYTTSGYFKKAELNWVRWQVSDSTGTIGLRAWYNLDAGTKGSTNSFGVGFTLIDYDMVSVGDGWYRCHITYLTTSTTSIFNFLVVEQTDLAAGPLGTAGNGIYGWGMQFEQGDEATTYVATTTAPVHNGTVIGQTEGTIFMELSSFADSTVKALFGISDGTVNNRILVYLDSTNVIIGNLQNAGVQQAQILSSTFTTGTNYKIALTYQNNKVALFVNGVKIGEDLTVTIPTMNQIRFDNGGGGSVNYSLGKCYSLLTTALTDAQAIALTTP